MKLPNGTAGMYWPSVPVAVVLYVRLDATVETVKELVASAVIRLFGASSGRISSTPFAVSPSEPTPYQLRTMSSSAVVAFASISIVVDFTPFDASSPCGVNVSA